MTDNAYSGRCLCGAVQFIFSHANLDHPSACHCGQCRQWSGHVWASINIPLKALRFDQGEERVKWYRASDYARRGFCENCGSSLFWHADGLERHKQQIAVALGALDRPTGVKLEEHIFVADKGDYYEIADGLPQKDAS